MLENIVNRSYYNYFFEARKVTDEDITTLYSDLNEDKEYFVNKYKVKDFKSRRKEYNVEIDNINGKLVRCSCDCDYFTNTSYCPHVLGVYFKFGAILRRQFYVDELKESLKIMNEFKESNDIKEKLRVELNFVTKEDHIEAKLKIGSKKLYIISMTNKFYQFIEVYNNSRKTFEIGKEFTYDSKKYYFDYKSEKLLNYFIDKNKYLDNEINSTFNINTGEFEFLISNYIDLVKINDKVVNEIKYENPIKYNLSLKDDIYTLTYDIFDYTPILHYKYMFKDNTLYVLNNKELELILRIQQHQINKISFEKKNIKKFTTNILKNIKNNIEIDDNIEDIKVYGKPTVKLYFDLNKDIMCTPKFYYKDIEVEYFKEYSILRDKDYEDEVINDIESNNFYIKNNKFVIEDEDLIYDFIDNKLNELSNKYEIYTNKKLETTNIVKKISCYNNFSIGKDGILSYSFDIGNIDKKEISGIINAHNNNKKYYKLKDNSIIKLDNSELNDTLSIIDELDLDSNDIKKKNIVIPKYRALYIDSIKSNRNISTDNSFNKFIDNFKKYKNTKISFDKFDKETLRDYQQDGVKWLTTLYKCGLGGILADEMGLGKSIQTISFIKQILKEKNVKILIVVPTSLVYNWKKEFDKFGSELKYITIADNKDKRQIIYDNIDNYNIFITSYGLVRNDIDILSQIEFELCILDEAQAIKNTESGITKDVKLINSKCKIALTGTPIENNITELWSIFDFIMPGYLNKLIKFKSKYKVNDINDDTISVLKVLSHQVSPFILRRKKIDVLTSLPDKIIDNVYIELNDVQKKIYINELNNTKKEIEEIIKTEGFNKSRIKILTLLTKLRQICIDPKVIYDNYNEDSSKIEELIKIVNESILNNHKILIFSSFKRVLDNLSKTFDDYGISHYMIDGSVKSKDRLDMVESFNKDNTSCFLITLKSGGTGLNLTGADIVIHLDIWWNPQVENQATDRAHRIGQTKTVNVIKLITKGTIEERIIELQDKKKLLADNIIEGNEEESLSKLTEKDIVNLLTYNNE